MTNETTSNSEFEGEEGNGIGTPIGLERSLRLLTICLREMLSVEDAALFLNRTKFSIWKLMAEKEIPYYVFKRRALFSRTELEEWMKNSGERMRTSSETDKQANKIIKELTKKRK